MRKSFFFLMCFFTLPLLGAEEQKKVLLQFGLTAQPLNYLAVFHLVETDLMNIAMETGESKVLKRERTQYVETRKELNRRAAAADTPFMEETGQAPLLENKTKLHILKNETEAGSEKTAKPATIRSNQFVNGRLVQPFDLADLATQGFPILLDAQKIAPNSEWVRPIDFKTEGLPSLAFDTKYTVAAFKELAGHPIIEVTYAFATVLRSTLISQDPLLQQKVADLKREDVESVEYKGQGRFTFDYGGGFVLTHSLTLTEKIRKSFIEGRQRKLQDLLRIYEYAEALIP